MRFRDRRSAGDALAPRIADATRAPTVVLGIPRGGVAVAAPIARALGAPLAAAWVKRLVSPREPDVVFGAVDISGDVTVAVEVVRAEGLSDEDVAEAAYHAHRRLEHELAAAPGLEAASLLPGACAVVVDDGVTTGLTMRAAMRWARREGARLVVIATPVADTRVWARLAPDADAAICLSDRDGPIPRSDVYEVWRRPTDKDVAGLLAEAEARIRQAAASTSLPPTGR
jgi:predicted phosphoribosyltransferase